MRIALVDDDARFLAQAVRLIGGLIESRGVSAELTTFASAERLLAARRDGTVFDIYFLDMIMPGMDGLTLGRRIRRDQSEVPIVFLTTSRDFALEAIGLDVADYVVKPFTGEAFARALDRALKRLSAVASPSLMLKAPTGYVTLALNDLVCARSDGHHLSIRTTAGKTLSPRLSMPELWDRLKDDVRFVRVGRQLLVNLAQVKGYAEGTLVLSDGETHSVPRRATADLKAAFARFYGV